MSPAWKAAVTGAITIVAVAASKAYENADSAKNPVERRTDTIGIGIAVTAAEDKRKQAPPPTTGGNHSALAMDLLERDWLRLSVAGAVIAVRPAVLAWMRIRLSSGRRIAVPSVRSALISLIISPIVWAKFPWKDTVWVVTPMSRVNPKTSVVLGRPVGSDGDSEPTAPPTTTSRSM